VYRARDTKLNRDVALKVYGLEESGGVRALVMELVEGEDLSGHNPRSDPD
jgi:hypothetical protein